jgi:hypothetical protein
MFVDPCVIVQFIQKIQQDAKMYQHFVIPYLYEAQHVSGDTAHHQEPKTALAASGFFIRGTNCTEVWVAPDSPAPLFH